MLVFDQIKFTNWNGSQTMEVPRAEATKIVEQYLLQYGTFEDDALGVYTQQSIGNNDKVTFMSFTAPKHVFQPRLNGCTWRPKGKIGSNQTELKISPIEMNMEQCPDAFWGCWEKMFGVGNEIHNMPSELVDQLLRLIYNAQGNSWKMMNEWGQHPVIDLSENNGWGQHVNGATEWDDFVDQQQATTGFMTIVDGLKDDGLSHFNVDISAFVNSTTGAVQGDMFDFLNLIITKRTNEFKIAERSGGLKGIIRLSEGFFDELGNQLLAQFQNIPDTYQLFLTGSNGMVKLNNALKYKGYAIIPETSWSIFDQITGTITHRAILSYPQVFALAYDVAGIDQFGGMGLVMQKSPYIRDKGRLDLMTTLKAGTAILDHKFVVNGSLLLTPQ